MSVLSVAIKLPGLCNCFGNLFCYEVAKVL